MIVVRMFELTNRLMKQVRCNVKIVADTKARAKDNLAVVLDLRELLPLTSVPCREIL
jgi:hypothetical protein